MMEETEDGFQIAEKDLELRGGGEVLGARQSGMPEFRVADVPGFEALLAAARDDASLVLSQDPHLASPRGEALRCCSTCSNATRPCACSAPRRLKGVSGSPQRGISLRACASNAAGAVGLLPCGPWRRSP